LNYLEQSFSSSALAIRQSRTIQSWVENPSFQPAYENDLFKSELTDLSSWGVCRQKKCDVAIYSVVFSMSLRQRE